MLTKSAIVVLALCAVVQAAPKEKDYENFDLPKTGQRAVVPESRLNHSSKRVNIKGGKVHIYEPSVNAQKFIFVKEAFVAEKRDEAIKLLRLEMDAGNKANRDNILLRLGQLYAEKYMELSFRETEIYSDQIQKYEKAKLTDKNAQAPKLDNSRSKAYLNDALGIFYSLEKEYPKHHKIDEIIFFIGFVEMEGGKPEVGLRYMERVVRQFPQSRKYDEAVVYLGDTYFEKHKFRDAAAKYSILLKRKNTELHDYAVYKLAWCRLNTGEAKQGLREMKSLVQKLSGSQDKAKFNLREQALKDLVVFYGEVEAVDEAMAFFTEIQGEEKAYENLKLIADILKSKARDDASAKAYAALMKRFGDSLDAPKISIGLYDSLARLGKNAQAAQVLSDAIERYGTDSSWAKQFPSEKAAELKAAQDMLSGEAGKIAMFHHQAGQKSANKGHFDQALQLYTALLKFYPNLPDKKKIAFYRGEILYAQGKWMEAADSYMETAKMLPKDKLTDESVYNALLALDRLTAKNDTIERYTKEQAKDVSQTPEAIPANEKRFIEVAEFYLKEYPQGNRVVDVKFRIAAIHFKYHHFDLAQKEFKDIALKHSAHRSAPTAAHIVLDIYNIKKDYETLNTEAQMFAAVKDLGDAKFKAEMAQIGGEVSFKSIEKLEASNKWGEAGEAYYNFYKNNTSNPLAEKALYNAIVSFEKANETPPAAEATRLFLTKFPKSEYSQRLTLSQAKAAERLYDFEQAQKLYLTYYEKFPKDKEAKKALYNAAVFAELMEWNKQALELYGNYLRLGADEDEKKAIELSFAKIHRKEKNWDKMAVSYRKLYRQAKSIDDKLAYLGELARQYDGAGKMTEKNNTLAEMKAIYESAKPKPKGSGVQYVAEAKLKNIGKAREKYEAVAFKFPPEDLVYLLKRKQKLLTKLSASYDEVVEVGVPEWGVAALFEKSNAYDHFVTAFRAVKIPARYKDEEKVEAEKALKQIDAQMVAPLEKISQEILKVCIQKATEFHVANEYASKCQERIKRGQNEVVASPSGLLPQPSYWSTRSLNDSIARK